jgi:hypothetical protein
MTSGSHSSSVRNPRRNFLKYFGAGLTAAIATPATAFTQTPKAPPAPWPDQLNGWADPLIESYCEMVKKQFTNLILLPLNP